jgi:disulfide bond formation protein DsbB
MTRSDPASPEPTAWTLLFAAWLLAAGSTLGALFLGEIMGLPPCTLCWWQRIFMFPIAVLLPFGLFPFDRRMPVYGLALAVPGTFVALFHQLLVSGLVPENIQPCTQGVPCSETVITWFGFLTIPLLSLAAFSVLVALLLAAQIRSRP